jgi:hypothetical protein
LKYLKSLIKPEKQQKPTNPQFTETHKQAKQQKEDNGLISLEKMFGEDTQVDRLTRQVREQGEKIELLEREISVLQNEKKSFFGFKRR